MMKKIFSLLWLILSFSFFTSSQSSKPKTMKVTSPDKKLELTVSITDRIQWTLTHEGDTVMAPSTLSLTLGNQGVLGKDPVLRRSSTEAHQETIATGLYKKSEVPNNYNQLQLDFKGKYSLLFRVFDQGAAYRFVTSFKDEVQVVDELATFNFHEAKEAYVPYAISRLGDRYHTSFESTYDQLKLHEIQSDSLIITPLMVALTNGKKAVITEADLEDYPGMFLVVNDEKNGFQGNYAPWPLEEEQGGHNNLQSIVTRRASYIAKTGGSRSFPWRVVAVAGDDSELLNNDLVFNLASPSRVEDISWIKPGKVAWDWWNALNLYGVDFEAGINTETYKYYIDFAADHNIEYVILDEGWSESTDLLKIVPEINLQEIVDYGKERNVGIVLWAGWAPLRRQMDQVYGRYSKMGVKGYKIDFMDRDDQQVVNFYYRAAREAARYNQFVDFHGAYKPTGLNRTWPNVLTFEGVYGLEQVKWTDYDDFPRYDVTAPFIRMLAGPMDYTPGAMKNATRQNFRAVFTDPMSQGTRCHQLAMYVVFESPFSMLADNPVAYMKEPESLEFISTVPTVFDETKALAGEVGEYVAIARRKGDTWYAGAMTNWNARELVLDLSFLSPGSYRAVIFADGVNADKVAKDYKKMELTVRGGDKLPIKMASGGGWVATFVPVK